MASAVHLIDPGDPPPPEGIKEDCVMTEAGSNGQSAKSVPGKIPSVADKTNQNGIPSSNARSSDRPRSFSEAVARSPSINARARFDCASVYDVGSSEAGKIPAAPLNPFTVAPNQEMLEEIVKEKDRLRDTAIFFSAVDLEKCPPRKFMDDWFHNYWNIKLGLHISFCRQLQKGLYVIFFVNHDAQQEVVKKQYWNVGSTSFRAIVWSPEAALDEVLALSAPRWVLVKNVPPFLWRFLPHLLAPIGKIIRMDETVRLIPHMDARVLISLSPGKDIPADISIKIHSDVYCCPVEVLGGLNACFLCRKEGHLRRDCPIVNKKPNPSNASPKDASNFPGANSKMQTNASEISTPPASSPKPLPENPPKVVNHSVSKPLSALIVQPSDNVGLQSFPVIDAAIDLNSDDGFTVVPHKKKRRKGFNNSAPKPFRPDSSKNQISVASDPVLTASHRLIKDGDGRNNPPAADQVRKLPTKIFQEIGEEYDFEIIPAAPVPSCSQIGPSMNMDSFVEAEEELIYGVSTARRRGRPPGSKNKPLVAKQGETSNSFLALTEHEFLADSSLNTVIQ